MSKVRHLNQQKQVNLNYWGGVDYSSCVRKATDTIAWSKQLLVLSQRGQNRICHAYKISRWESGERSFVMRCTLNEAMSKLALYSDYTLNIFNENRANL